MSIIFSKDTDLSVYSTAIVYLKDEKTPYIQIDGGKLAVTTDDDTITVKTANSFTAIASQDVLAITFK